ncbi:MAG: hypothetical protein V4850_24150 [Myxococcota bacterium]
MSLLLIAALSAHAATFTAEDLVLAHGRGLPVETAARMAESVGTDAPTAVYLLRRGVSAETLTTWGYTIGQAEQAEAAQSGALTTPPPASPVPWADPRVLAAEIHDAPDERDVLPGPPSARVAHARRGGVSTGIGALLLATGGASLLAGSGVVGPSPNVSWASLRSNYGIDVYPSGGNTVLSVAGMVGLLAGGVTLHFGARELRLAGDYPGGWTPSSPAP